MKTFLSILAGLVVLLIAAVLVVPGLIDWTAHKDRITAQIESATGREVSIEGDLSLSLLPRPSFAAENVHLSNLAEGSRPEMARARALRIELNVAPLLQGNIEVREVVLVEPEILLEVLPDGRRNWNFADDERGAPLPVSLESFRIVRGSVTYHDARAGVIEQITDAELNLTAGSLNGPFTLAGNLSVRGVGLGVEGVLGRLDRERGTSFNLSMTLPGDDAQLRFNGTFARAIDGAADARASLRLEGSNLERSLSLAGLEDVPAALGQGYRFSSEIRLDEGSVRASDLDLRLGDTSASGTLQLAFGAPMEGAARLSIQRLNLDDFIAMSEGGGIGGDLLDPAELTLPEWLEGTFDLDIGALVYREQMVRQGRLHAELTEGTLYLREASALLPGGGSLALSGRATAEPAFSGRIEAGADNLRGLLDWLDIPADGVPAQRLRRMSLLSDIQVTPGQLTASSLDLSIDAMKITGGVVAALRARPALGVGLSVDRLDLDGYLPEDSGDGWPLLEVPPVFDTFDANFDLRAGSVDYRGETARGVVLDATLQRGSLDVRRAVLGELAESRIAFTGTLDSVTGSSGGVDGTLEVDMQEARNLLRLIDREDLLPPGLGPMSLEGTLQGDASALGIDVRLHGLDGFITASGDLRPLSGPPEADLSVTVRHDDLAALLARLDYAPTLDGEALANGEELGALDLSARVGATPLRIEAHDLSGTLGPVSLSGQLAADIAEGRPMVTANLESGELFVPLLLGLLQQEAPADEAGGESGEGERHWSDTPIDFSALQALDADLTLRAGSLMLSRETRMGQTAINIGLRNGVLDIERFAAALHDGEVTMSGTLDSRETPTFGGRLRIDGMESAGLWENGLPGRISGPLDLEAQINARGVSERALLNNLSGAGSVSGTLTLWDELAEQEDQAARLLADLLGDGAGAIDGVEDAGTALIEAFAGKSADLTGRFAARNGVFTTDDLTLRGPEVRAILTGEADLPRWRSEARIDLLHKDDPGEGPYMSMLLNGALDQPDPTIQGGPFRPAKAERVEAPAIDFESLRQDAETAAPEVQEPAVPEDSLHRPTAEDIIRDVLDDLDR